VIEHKEKSNNIILEDNNLWFVRTEFEGIYQKYVCVCVCIYIYIYIYIYIWININSTSTSELVEWEKQLIEDSTETDWVQTFTKNANYVWNNFMCFIERFSIDKGNYHVYAERLYHFKQPPKRKCFHLSGFTFHVGKRYFMLD